MRGSFFFAALTCLVLAGLHVFGGGPVFIPPIITATELGPTIHALAYFVWHVGTLYLLAMAGGFVWAAISQEIATAVMATAMSVGAWMICLAVAAFVIPDMWRLPGPYVFAGISVFGGLGIYLALRPRTLFRA